MKWFHTISNLIQASLKFILDDQGHLQLEVTRRQVRPPSHILSAKLLTRWDTIQCSDFSRPVLYQNWYINKTLCQLWPNWMSLLLLNKFFFPWSLTDFEHLVLICYKHQRSRPSLFASNSRPSGRSIQLWSLRRSQLCKWISKSFQAHKLITRSFVPSSVIQQPSHSFSAP